ncbi:hypothetical protein JCM15519_06190 [Fundidesulfovibrio butyratiphilus]
MSKMASFTKLEHELSPKLRERMGLAESTADAQKFFVYSVLELLNGVLAESEEQIEIEFEEIRLTPDQAPGYALSTRLTDCVPLAAALRESDLPAILARFAEVAGKRFNALKKNPAKTEAKIYHGTDQAPR